MEIYINGKLVMELKDNEDVNVEVKDKKNSIAIGNSNICISGGSNQIGNSNYQNNFGSASVGAEFSFIEIEINGNVGKFSSNPGNVTIKGDCNDDVSVMNGNLKAKVINGNAETKNGNIKADEINGDCSARNGNVMKGN